MRSRAEATGSRRRLLAVAAMLAATSMGCSDDGTGPARTVVEVFGPVVGEPGQRLADAFPKRNRIHEGFRIQKVRVHEAGKQHSRAEGI